MLLLEERQHPIIESICCGDRDLARIELCKGPLRNSTVCWEGWFLPLMERGSYKETTGKIRPRRASRRKKEIADYDDSMIQDADISLP
jgi:hypothetical protein